MTTRLCIKRLSPFCEQRAVLLQVHSCSIYGNIARVSTRQITDHWQSTYRHLPHRSKLALRKHITLVHDRGAMADASSTDRRGGGGRSDEVSSLRLPRMHFVENTVRDVAYCRVHDTPLVPTTGAVHACGDHACGVRAGQIGKGSVSLHYSAFSSIRDEQCGAEMYRLSKSM